MAMLAPGARFGGCRIEAVVGRGGMGVVYRARQLDLDRDVALKVIAPELVEDEPTRRRFLSEARAAAAIEHPNVVPVHAVGIADGRAYLVMRFVVGDDLRTLVRRDGPLTPQRAAEVTARVGDALDAIHRAGYVHRDVKPQNVMVAQGGHVYLSDFGLAKQALATAGPTTSEHWVGTLDYVAPEQIRGEPVDGRADVYALGGVLAFMLTARVPFDRPTDDAKLWAHLHDPPPRPSATRPELPAAFDAIVARAMAKDPAARQPTGGDLGFAAVEAAAGRAPAETVSARRHPAAGRGRGPRRRIAAAATGIAAVAAAAAWLLGGGDDPARRAARTATPPPAATPVAVATRAPPRVGPRFPDVGFHPRDVLVAGGAVWVLSIHESRIARLDQVTGERRGSQPAVGRGAAGMAADDGIVWVVKAPTQSVLGLHPRTGKVLRRIVTPMTPVRVAAGPTGLWIAARESLKGPGFLLRYDRDGTGAALQTEEFADGIQAIALGGGAAWVALKRSKRIVRVAPGAAPDPFTVLRSPASSLAYGAGYVWATVPDGDTLVRVARGRGQTFTRAAGRGPSGVVVAGGRVYVSSFTSHEVLVFEPERLRRPPLRLDVAANPYAVAAGAGHVWVTGHGHNTLTRIDY